MKYAFSYEQWESFGTLIEPTLQLLHEQSDINSLVDIKTLQLMLALEPFYNTVKKPKKTPVHTDEGDSAAHAHGRFFLKLQVMLGSRFTSLGFNPCQGHCVECFWARCLHSHSASLNLKLIGFYFCSG